MGRKYSRTASAGGFDRYWTAFLQIANSRAAEILDKRFKRDKRKPSKGGRELWYVNHMRGEKGGGSFSFNTEKGVAHDFADPSFNLELIGLVCLHDGLGKGKEARLQAVRVIAGELGLEVPWFARDGDQAAKGGDAKGGEAAHGWRFYWRSAHDLHDPAVRQHADLSVAIDYFAGRGLDGLDRAHLGVLKVHRSLPYYAMPGDKPILIGQYPAMLAALTEGGQGDPLALQRTWLMQGLDGLPTKLDVATLKAAA